MNEPPTINATRYEPGRCHATFKVDESSAQLLLSVGRLLKATWMFDRLGGHHSPCERPERCSSGAPSAAARALDARVDLLREIDAHLPIDEYEQAVRCVPGYQYGTQRVEG